MVDEAGDNGVAEPLDIHEVRDTARLEAFSDGVFAVAITLLVLEIKIPRSHDWRLLHDLLGQWPEYVAYFFSFIMIGIYWMNHHHIFKYIRYADQVLMFLNVLLLSCIVLIPFGTGLLAEYIAREPLLERYAAVVFTSIGLVSAIMFNVLWRYAARNRHLLEPALEDGAIKALLRDYDLGILFFAIAVGLVYVSVPLSLGLILISSIFFARPARLRSASRHGPHR